MIFSFIGEPENLINEKWIVRTLPFDSGNVVAGQRFYDKKLHFDLISNFYFKPEISITFSLVLILFGLSCLCFSGIHLKEKKIKFSRQNFFSKVLFLVENFVYSNIASFNAIILFFALFRVFCTILVNCNIKTNTVIVSFIII